MLENLYTTKMSMDKKKLQNRFAKIRSENGGISKLMALIIFAVILVIMACVSIIIAAGVRSDEYIMTEKEFSGYISRPVGSIMAEFDYMDDKKLVFHYLGGLFVKDLENGEMVHRINLEKLNISQHQQGSNVLDVKIDKDGKYAYLSSIGAADEIKDFDSYIIDLSGGTVKTGTMPDGTMLFEGYRDTHETYPDAFGWYSNTCIISGETGYYLTVRDAFIGALELVCVSPDGEVKSEYVFGNYAASFEKSRMALIREVLPEDFSLDTEKRYSYEMNGKELLKLYNIAGFSGTHGVDDGGNYDVRIYNVRNREHELPYLFVVDNYKDSVVSYTEIGNEKLLEEILYFLEGKSDDLYFRTVEFLESEMHRVFDPYYDITSLEISNWNSNGTEATFFYKMKHVYYNRDPDKAEYIRKAKESGNPNYKKMYDEYLEEKEANFEFLVKVSPSGELLLYSNVSPVGEPVWDRTEIDDYVLE